MVAVVQVQQVILEHLLLVILVQLGMAAAAETVQTLLQLPLAVQEFLVAAVAQIT
jgi:hypothetical protein